MIFEWDERKRLINNEKHGIDFVRGKEIFYYPYVSIPSDYQNEERFLAIGKINDDYITVVYTNRGEKIRIISVRRSRKNERKAYDNEIGRGT